MDAWFKFDVEKLERELKEKEQKEADKLKAEQCNGSMAVR